MISEISISIVPVRPQSERWKWRLLARVRHCWTVSAESIRTYKTVEGAYKAARRDADAMFPSWLCHSRRITPPGKDYEEEMSRHKHVLDAAKPHRKCPRRRLALDTSTVCGVSPNFFHVVCCACKTAGQLAMSRIGAVARWNHEPHRPEEDVFWDLQRQVLTQRQVNAGQKEGWLVR